MAGFELPQDVVIPREGDPPRAWEPLYLALRRPALAAITGVIGPHEAEDVWHELFTRLMKAPRILSSVRREAIIPYVRAAARARALNARRGRERATRRAAASAPFAHSVAEPVAVARAEIADLLQQLPETDREIVSMRYLEGLTLNEVAGVLDLTVSAVAVRAFRALSRLRAAGGSEL